jgi:hypothetical protein
MVLYLYLVVEWLGRLLDEPLGRRPVPLDGAGPPGAAPARPVVFLVHRALLCRYGGIEM